MCVYEYRYIIRIRGVFRTQSNMYDATLFAIFCSTGLSLRDECFSRKRLKFTNYNSQVTSFTLF